MRSLGLIVGLSAALLSTVAAAQTQIPPALPANPTPQAMAPAEQTAPVLITDNTVICIYERQTGTLFTNRVCRTHRAWDLMHKDAAEFMEYGARGSHQDDTGG
jgi:hypothetical protein